MNKNIYDLDISNPSENETIKQNHIFKLKNHSCAKPATLRIRINSEEPSEPNQHITICALDYNDSFTIPSIIFNAQMMRMHNEKFFLLDANLINGNYSIAIQGLGEGEQKNGWDYPSWKKRFFKIDN